MRPRSLSVTNFIPYRGTTTVDFSKIQAAVISGPNGCGKSSFFIDSIDFALNGNARSTINEELVCDGETSASVTFTFNHNEKIYVVIRTLQKDKGQTLKLYAFEPGKEDDGIDLSDRLLKNTQATLYDIIGVSQDLLFCTSIAQQDEINKLSLITPAQREQILSEMLNLGIWERKKKKVTEYLNQEGGVLKRLEELELSADVLRGNITERNEKLIELHRVHAEAEVKCNELSGRIFEVQKEFTAREQRLKQQQVLQEQVTILQTEIATLKLNIEKAGPVADPETVRERVEAIGLDIQECQELVVRVNKEVEHIQERIAKWNNREIEVRALREQELATTILGTVPCKGLDIHSKCSLLSNAQDIKKRIDAFIAGQPSPGLTLEAIQQHAESEKKTEDQKYRQYLQNKDQLRDRINTLSTEMERQQGLIKTAEQIVVWQKLIATKEEFLHQKSAELGSINVTWDPSILSELQKEFVGVSEQKIAQERDINNIEDQIAVDEKAMLQVQAEVNSLQPKKDRVVHLKMLQQAYTDIPALLFTNIIPYVESYANEFMIRIAADRRIYLRAYRDTKAGTQVKTLDVIGTTSTGVRNFRNLSGSEKFRESLALRIALAKVNAELYNTQIGFFIIDEGFGSLDEINVLLIKNALREAAKDFDLFLAITHVPELVDTFSQRIIVRPAGKEKRIEVIEHAPTSEVALDT